MSGDEFVGSQWSKQELAETLKVMRDLNHNFYVMCFTSGLGARCHAFLEFNGLMSKFVDLCERAYDNKIDFSQANQHGGVELPVEEHDIEYLGEKFRCIFDFAIQRSPKLKDAFVRGFNKGKR
jgi:hypothetical protein